MLGRRSIPGSLLRKCRNHELHFSNSTFQLTKESSSLHSPRRIKWVASKSGDPCVLSSSTQYLVIPCLDMITFISLGFIFGFWMYS